MNSICSVENCERPSRTKGMCGSHYNHLQRTGGIHPIHRRPSRKPKHSVIGGRKICLKCLESKEVSDFTNHGSDESPRYSSRCRSCRTLAVKGRPRKSEKGRRKFLYGLTKEKLKELEIKQNYRCAVCGTDNPGADCKVLCIDHCHATGKVRGLLCNNCNRGLGFFKDDPARLIAASNYILHPVLPQ